MKKLFKIFNITENKTIKKIDIKLKLVLRKFSNENIYQGNKIIFFTKNDTYHLIFSKYNSTIINFLSDYKFPL